MTTRILLYSHDAVGLGHVRRNLAIAHALSDTLPGRTGTDVAGLLVTGVTTAARFTPPPGWDWLIMPGFARTADGYAPRQLGVDSTDLASVRAATFAATAEAFAPDMIIIDRHPFGVAEELRSALAAIRRTSPDCAIVLGLREVLDTPSTVQREWRGIGGAAAIRTFFDAVWVYGDPSVHDLRTSGELPVGIEDLVDCTGYLGHGRPEVTDRPVEDAYVLTVVGGGSDGGALAEAAAAAPVPPGYRHLVVTGPQMPEEQRAAVVRAATPMTEVISAVPDALTLTRHAAAVVCMGGYNTLAEVLTTSTPALVAPRVQRRREQAIRAEAMAAHDLIDVLPPDRVSAAEIGRWLHRRVGERIDRIAVDLDGLDRVGELAAQLLAGCADRSLTLDAVRPQVQVLHAA